MHIVSILTSETLQLKFFNRLGINLKDKYWFIFHRNRVAIGKFSASNPLDVDHYHYISADNPWGSDTSGVAKQMGYYGWKYDGTVCWLDKKERTAITEFWGNPNDWDDLEQTTVKLAGSDLLASVYFVRHNVKRTAVV